LVAEAKGGISRRSDGHMVQGKWVTNSCDSSQHHEAIASPVERLHQKGVVYCVTGGYLYFLLAYISMASLRENGYTGPICLVTDLPAHAVQHVASKLGITVRTVSVPDVGRFSQRWLKTTLVEVSPFDTSLFLDADTFVLRRIDDMWANVENTDLAMALDVYDKLISSIHSSSREKEYTLSVCPPESPQYNTGVLLWRRTEATRRFFAEWHREWARFHEVDQLAAIRAHCKTQPTTTVLEHRFNEDLGAVRNLNHATESNAVIWHSYFCKESILLALPLLHRRQSYVIITELVRSLTNPLAMIHFAERKRLKPRDIVLVSSFLTYSILALIFKRRCYSLGYELMKFIYIQKKRWRKKYGSIITNNRPSSHRYQRPVITA